MGAILQGHGCNIAGAIASDDIEYFRCNIAGVLFHGPQVQYFRCNIAGALLHAPQVFHYGLITLRAISHDTRLGRKFGS